MNESYDNGTLIKVLRAFGMESGLLDAQKLNIGNVNQTFKVLLKDGKKLIVQALNTRAFPHPELVMHNAALVAQHIRERSKEYETLYFYKTADGLDYFETCGSYWRISSYIPSRTFMRSTDPEVLFEAGRAIGDFEVLLSDLDASQLYYTIPDFHNTRLRFETLFKNAERDPYGLKKNALSELEYLKSIEDRAFILEDMRGLLPIRVTHNDTKINNVLFDEHSIRALAVIDLDTVMPGLFAHDFGDALRYAANSASEDCLDASLVSCDMRAFRAFTDGILSRTADMLTENELDTLPQSPFVMASELAARFLDDYITGSKYFKTNYPEHNLDRARCQIALSRDFFAKLPEIKDALFKLYKKHISR